VRLIARKDRAGQGEAVRPGGGRAMHITMLHEHGDRQLFLHGDTSTAETLPRHPPLHDQVEPTHEPQKGQIQPPCKARGATYNYVFVGA